MNSNTSRGMCAMCCTSVTLVIIGALNWGLIGLGGFFGSDWNVVYWIFGGFPTLEWIVYILIGLAGVMTIISWNQCCLSTCQRKGMGE